MKKLVTVGLAALGVLAVRAAVLPAQVAAETTGIMCMNAGTFAASPFWARVKKGNPGMSRNMDQNFKGMAGSVSEIERLTVCMLKDDSAGVFVECANGVEALFRRGVTPEEFARQKATTLYGYKAYVAADGSVFVVLSPRQGFGALSLRDDRKGGVFDGRAVAAKFLDPKAPKLAPGAPLAKFLVIAPGQWARGAFADLGGLTGRLKKSGKRKQADLMDPSAMFAKLRTASFTVFPGRAPESAGFTVRGGCADEAAAAGIVNFCTLMKAMLAMGGFQGADGAVTYKPEQQAFFNGLDLSADGTHVNMTGELPASLLDGVLDEGSRRARQTAARRRKAPAAAVPATKGAAGR